MARRRRLIVIMATPGRLGDVREAEIGEVQFVDPGATEEPDWENETINEGDLTSEQVDGLNDLAATV